MKVLLSFLLSLLLICAHAIAQEALIQPFIRAWKVSGTSQTHVAQTFYDTLLIKRTDKHYQQYFHQVVNAMYSYLKDHPDKRLEARTIIYEALGAIEYDYPRNAQRLPLEKAMTLALDLGDEQLLAEIYALYSYLPERMVYPLYNLKALELQRKIGFEHFCYVQNRLFDASRALYFTRDYRQAITFGEECLQLRDPDAQRQDPALYIYQLDILGACYKELGIYDSVNYYYRQLEKHLPAIAHKDTLFQQLWKGIARGNLGHVMALQGKYSAALPLIREHLQSSIARQDGLNIAMAQNRLAYIYHRQGAHTMALAAWRQALYWAEKNNSPENALQATASIAESLRLSGKTDSAFYYYFRYHTYKDTLEEHISLGRLSTINAKLAFDDLQSTLYRSQATLDKLRFTRNAILVSITLAAIILLLLYNRYRLQHRFALLATQRKHEQALQEVQRAREQIAAFTNHIIEKNNLIDALQQQVALKDQSEQNTAVTVHLLQYTLFTDDEWEKFKSEFAKAYPDFLQILRERIEQITPAEERLAALIYLQLNTYQIANTLGNSKDSVQRSKRKLKKRLNLPEPVTVEEYIYNLLTTK